MEGADGPITYTVATRVIHRGRAIGADGRDDRRCVIYACTLNVTTREPNAAYNARNESPKWTHGPQFIGDTSHLKYLTKTRSTELAITLPDGQPRPTADQLMGLAS
ncbi:MAG TPA: hypothetical protein VIO38_16875 [Rariglobus sp.]